MKRAKRQEVTVTKQVAYLSVQGPVPPGATFYDPWTMFWGKELPNGKVRWWIPGKGWRADD